MSIIIQNIGGDPIGVCKYQVRINDKIITWFEHNRPDGLSTCLNKAAIAVEEAKWEQIKVLFKISEA